MSNLVTKEKQQVIDNPEKIYGENVDFIYTADEFDELREAAALSEKWSVEYCEKKDDGGMEEWVKKNIPIEAELTCDWYHSAWPVLRLANMVAVPKWYKFYVDELSNILHKNPKAKVMISACADYGMLAKLHKAIEKTNTTPSISIYDICETPLKSCEWYAAKHKIEIACARANIINENIPDAPFDLIVTDEFLSVLHDDYKPAITDRWFNLLKPGGSVVTTAMVGQPTTPELRKYYEKKALDFFSHSPVVAGTKLSDEYVKEKCTNFAMRHTRHMIKNEKQLRTLFSHFKRLSLNPIVTPGECVNPTTSYQIVAGI